jgi:hypothetical protein
MERFLSRLAGEVASEARRRGQAMFAPSTMLRMVPLPRLAGEEPAVPFCAKLPVGRGLSGLTETSKVDLRSYQ